MKEMDQVYGINPTKYARLSHRSRGLRKREMTVKPIDYLAYQKRLLKVSRYLVEHDIYEAMKCAWSHKDMKQLRTKETL